MGACLTNITSPTQICGNNIIEGNEECDNTAFGGETCITKGYDGGSLYCYSSNTPNECAFDTSQCITLSQPEETPTPETSYYCGDGTCNQRESSFTCPKDCKAEKPKKSYVWLFVLLLIIVLSAIAFVSFVIYKKLYKKNSGEEKTSGNQEQSA